MAANEIHPESRTLSDWLLRLEQLHPRTIEMGLERVSKVWAELGLAPTFPIITVGGTNGKGSTCIMLESILSHSGYRVGCYTSPHLLRYNERVRIGRREASDSELCDAFQAVESARIRSGLSLTYFEFGTLAAMQLFVQAAVDVAILEVGLGGRLDAVNIFDADCAVLTSVDFDHMDYLGETREMIGFEKAGIFRKGNAAICSEPDMPAAVRLHAETIGAELSAYRRTLWLLHGCERVELLGKRGKAPFPPVPGPARRASVAQRQCLPGGTGRDEGQATDHHGRHTPRITGCRVARPVPGFTGTSGHDPRCGA